MQNFHEERGAESGYFRGKMRRKFSILASKHYLRSSSLSFFYSNLASMKSILTLSFILFFLTLFSQNEIATLKEQLQSATTIEDKAQINFDLADAYLQNRDSTLGLDYAKTAFRFYTDLERADKSAEAAYQVALFYERKRNSRSQDVWLKAAENNAKKALDRDLYLKTIEKRTWIAKSILTFTNLTAYAEKAQPKAVFGGFGTNEAGGNFLLIRK